MRLQETRKRYCEKGGCGHIVEGLEHQAKELGENTVNNGELLIKLRAMLMSPRKRCS